MEFDKKKEEKKYGSTNPPIRLATRIWVFPKLFFTRLRKYHQGKEQ